MNALSLRELRALFRSNPTFRRVLLADLLSQIGDGGILVAFPMLILEQTGDVTLTGLAFSGEVAAFALLSPLAGFVADRFEQRRVMIAADSARVCFLALLLLVLAFHASFGALLAASVAFGASGAFFMPARAAFMRRVLEGADLERAIALEGTVAFLTRLISPALMGLLLAILPPVAGIAFDLVAYASAIVLLAPRWVRGTLSVEKAADEGAWQEGWLCILRSVPLRSLLGLDLALCLVGMAAFSSSVAFLSEHLQLSAQSNCWLLAATGLTGALGTQLAGRLGRGGGTYAALTGLVALTYLLVPHAHSLGVMVAMWGLRGFAYGALGVLINQRIVQEAAPQVMGRVNAAWSLVACLAAFFGSASTPFLLRTIGSAQSFTLFGITLASAAILMGAQVAARSAQARRTVEQPG